MYPPVGIKMDEKATLLGRLASFLGDDWQDRKLPRCDPAYFFCLPTNVSTLIIVVQVNGLHFIYTISNTLTRVLST